MNRASKSVAPDATQPEPSGPAPLGPRLELPVLVRVDGDEEKYVGQAGDVLYNINRLALAALLNVRRGPSTINAGTLGERIAMIVEEIGDQPTRRRLGAPAAGACRSCRIE